MIDQDERSQRLAAAQAFFESLDNQLQETLQSPDSRGTKSQPQSGSVSRSQPEIARKKSFTLADLEDAVADIEQFFQSKNAESNQSKD